MRVRATKPGFYVCLRLPDTESAEFDVPDNEPASTWFEPVQPAASAKKPKKQDGQAPADDGQA